MDELRRGERTSLAARSQGLFRAAGDVARPGSERTAPASGPAWQPAGRHRAAGPDGAPAHGPDRDLERRPSRWPRTWADGALGCNSTEHQHRGRVQQHRRPLRQRLHARLRPVGPHDRDYRAGRRESTNHFDRRLHRADTLARPRAGHPGRLSTLSARRHHLGSRLARWAQAATALTDGISCDRPSTPPAQ